MPFMGRDVKEGPRVPVPGDVSGVVTSVTKLYLYDWR